MCRVGQGMLFYLFLANVFQIALRCVAMRTAEKLTIAELAAKLGTVAVH